MQYVRILAKCSVRSRHLALGEIVPADELGKDAAYLVRIGRAEDCAGPTVPETTVSASQSQDSVEPGAPIEKKRGKRVR
jgi:hypothetical protein